MVLATSVPVASPRKITLDAHGNIYLADNGNNVVWFEDATTGYMRVIAGTVGLTTGGAGCPAQPGKDTATLIVKSSLGATSQFGLSGIGNTAAVALDPGTSATIGTGYKAPVGIALDAAGNTYVADTGNNVVLRYDSAGTGSIIAGSVGVAGNGGIGGLATSATLSAPSAVAVTPDGAIYIADTGNGVIRRIDPVSGVINVAAGVRRPFALRLSIHLETVVWGHRPNSPLLPG
jgi:hypothetical protein